MPWTAEDAKRFTSAADTPKKQRQWAEVANSMLESCLKGGGEQKNCEARAVKAANAAVSEEAKVEKEFLTEVVKRDDEKRLVYGVVLVPDEEDSQGDICPPEVIERAAHGYLMKSRSVAEQHKELANAHVVESFIAPADLKYDGKQVRKGSWIIAVKIADDRLWKAVKDGEYSGFSIGGIAKAE